jgi:hypothetical protein
MKKKQLLTESFGLNGSENGLDDVFAFDFDLCQHSKFTKFYMTKNKKCSKIFIFYLLVSYIP